MVLCFCGCVWLCFYIEFEACFCFCLLEESCREVLEKSVGEKCSGEMLEKSLVEECWGEVL